MVRAYEGSGCLLENNGWGSPLNAWKQGMCLLMEKVYRMDGMVFGKDARVELFIEFAFGFGCRILDINCNSDV